MAKNNKKKVEPEEPPGAPDWMVTFSDCMTLLLTFFVLLLSFSSFEPGKFNSMISNVGKGIPSMQNQEGQRRDSISRRDIVTPIEKSTKGSKVLTMTEDEYGNMRKKKRLTNFRNQKVFAIRSDKIFWGKGTTLTNDGKSIMENMAYFLKHSPSRVVISESDLSVSGKSDQIGQTRAVSVCELLQKNGLDKGRFSVTGSSMMPKKKAGRYLVITLLERNMYK